ncbi:cytochrome b N-terminal domain-containing protein [Komagataeibacter rhaeticus]|nr:cytochrome b N-terminal domain-containing protein [Komagataeibacter rhaeticus]
MRKEYVDFPMPRNLNALWDFGAILTVVLVIMLASGIFLAMNYTPTASEAFLSVEMIERQLPAGWMLRALHVTGASLFMAALYVHLFRGLYYGSYKQPREILWLTGLVLLVMVMVTAFAGYVLPWGQMSYWGRMSRARQWGRYRSSGLRLNTSWKAATSWGYLHPPLFVLHFVMAFAIVGIVALHVAALHVSGPNNPTGRPVPARETVPFHPITPPRT